MKKLLLALLTGILLALAWPTYGFPLLLFVGFVPLLLAEYQIRRTTPKHAGWRVFGLAYLSFFVWNMICTYWIYFSTPFGMWFAVLANSLLMALVFLLYHFIAKKTPFTAASSFLVALWICFEKLHLNWDFSWPWLNLGNGFSEYITWIQWYEYTGTFGGTLWVWLVNIAIFKGILLYLQHTEKTILYRSLLKATALVIIPIGISFLLWKNYPSTENQQQLETLILQPNINPYTEKYNTDDAQVGKLLQNLTAEKINDSTALVLAPETVYADGTNYTNFEYSIAESASRKLLTDFPRANFLGGVSMYERITDSALVKPQTNFLKEGVWFNDYNSAFLINTQSTKTQLYHKSKLVVGVENFPYPKTLKPLLGNIMIDLGGTVAMKTTQADREVFTLNSGEKTAPIICYESVYGEFVAGYVKNNADFLAIITNDAWWKNTQGHQQHLSYARLRAIETRRDVVRSANTGISAFINQKGEILQRLGYEKRGNLIGKIHLNTRQTFYVKFGDYIARVAQFLALFIFLFAIIKHRRNRK